MDDPFHVFQEIRRAYLRYLDSPFRLRYDALLDERRELLDRDRQLYRSEFLLDQDRAVRSVNLANIYRDAGMFDLSVREAARAVSLDYGNYSAHLFLANSYNELRDPNRINLRYETPAESEFLVANLLAPVTAGTLSPTISQQEYSRLFERDRFGIVSETEYLSRGAWTQSGAQYGVFGNTGYALDALYRTDPGQRPNNDFEERQLSLQVKQQLTAKDSIYLQALDYHAEGGDLLQYYDQSMANPGVRVKEREDPILVAGYHREWSPGAHSLFLATRLKDHVSLDNPSQTTFFVSNPGGVGIGYVAPESINETLRRDLEIYSFEFQQIWQRSRNSLILGTRLQLGHFDTENLQINDSGAFRLFFPQPAASQSIRSGFERFSAYGYDCFKLAENLMFVAGLSYDRIKFPENRRAAPVSDQETTATRVSPKAGVVWIPLKGAVIRGAYTRSLSGAGPDQSFQLEPSQVAGFNQTFAALFLNRLVVRMPAPGSKPMGFRSSRDSAPKHISVYRAKS